MKKLAMALLLLSTMVMGKEIKEPKNMPVETLKNTQLIVNKKAAEKYGIDLGALEGAKLY